MAKSVVCLLLMCCCFSSVWGRQAGPTDSLYVEQMAAKADNTMMFDVDSGFYYANRILAYGREGDFDFAIATGYEKLGWSYWVAGNYADGLKYALDAIRLFEDYGQSQGLTTSLLAAGRNLFEQRSYNMASNYYNRAKIIAESLGLEKALVEVYRDLGGISVFSGKYEEGFDYCRRGLAIANRIGDRISIAIFYSHIAVIHFNQGDIEESIDYNWRAILEGRLNGNRRIVAVCFERLALIDLQNGMYDEAIRKAKETLEMGQQLGSSLITMRAYMVLSRGYEGKKQHEQSLNYYKAYAEISDSTYNADKESIIASMEAVYSLESKEHEIELLETERALNEQASKAKNYFIVLSIVIIALLVALTFALFRASQFQISHNTVLRAKNEEIAKQAAKLGQMNATKSKIFSIIGHDLRSSVANLKQLLDLLNSEEVTLKELKEVAPEAKQSVDASFDVLDNLLHWGLSQMEGIRTNIEPVELKNIVSELRSHFQPMAERKDISLTFDIPDNTRVAGDGPQLTVVLRNLLGNAIKFTKNGGAIILKADEIGSVVRLSVIDNGVGIPKEKLSFLFKQESHYSEMGTNDEKGTGLGLLLCHEFVGNMGGSLQVDSKPGEGTTFSFDLKKA